MNIAGFGILLVIVLSIAIFDAYYDFIDRAKTAVKAKRDAVISSIKHLLHI